MTGQTILDPAQLAQSLGRFRQWVLPAGVMRELMHQGSDVMPALRQRLDAAVQSEEQGLGTDFQEAFFCYHLLGIAPDPSLRTWLDRLFHCEKEKIEQCCGTITEQFMRALLTAIADREDIPDYCQWIDSLVRDDEISDYLKLLAVESLFSLVGENALDDSVAVDWVKKWLDERQAVRQDELSAFIVASLVDIGGKDLKDLADTCFRRDQINQCYINIGSLADMHDERQVERLRQQAEADRQILSDPVAYLASWHAFAWATEDLDPQSATYSRLPSRRHYPSKQADSNQIQQWLKAIDQSNYENYPATPVDKLNCYIGQTIEPLVERVRRGIEAAKQGQAIADKAPYLALMLLARNTDAREILFNDAKIFLDVYDLTAEQRCEWFGDSINDHLVKAISQTLVGQTQPIVDRVLDATRDDVDRASLIPYFVLSVYQGYLDRNECIRILRELWDSLNREGESGKTGMMFSKMAIFDAACMISLPDTDPLMRQADEQGITNFCLSPELAKLCREQPQQATKVVEEELLASTPLLEAIKRGMQFSSAAIDPQKKSVTSKTRTGKPNANIKVPSTLLQTQGEIRKNEIKNDAALRVGRNDLCPCGSGKKYKRCCL